MSDDYSNTYCEWCNKSIIRKEAKLKTDKYTGIKYTVCVECYKFPTKEAMELWYSIEVDWRLLKYIPVLDSIEDLGDNNWTIHYTIKYEENPNAREGWIA